MSEKLKRKHLLLAAFISLGLTTFGCSSPGSNSEKAKETPQPSPAASVPASTPQNSETSPSTSAASDGKENPSTPTAPVKKGSALDYYQQGIASAKQGDLKSTEEAWRKSIQLDPKNAEVQSNLGVLLQRQGKAQEAIDHYKEAISLAPDNADTHVKLAVALGQQRKLDESIAQSKEAIRLKPDFAQAHFVLAAGLAEQGKKDEALVSLRKTRELLQTQGQTEQATKVDELIQKVNQQK